MISDDNEGNYIENHFVQINISFLLFSYNIVFYFACSLVLHYHIIYNIWLFKDNMLKVCHRILEKYLNFTVATTLTYDLL